MKYKKISNNVVDERYVKEIITDYDALSQASDECDVSKSNKEIQNIVIELKNTIRANSDMIGLSAPQIGYNKRLFCLNFNGDIKTFINPVIDSADLVKGQLTLSVEQCHSEPNRKFIRLRYDNISVIYQTPTGEIKTVRLLGMAAFAFQHHLDHLNGLLLSDVALEIDDDFYKLTEEERGEIIKMYLDSIDMSATQLKEEIESDNELSELYDAARFVESVRQGETIIEQMPMSDEEIEAIKKGDSSNGN